MNKEKLSLNKKLDKILENEDEILKNQRKILSKEEEIKELEEEEISKEEEIKELEEEEISKEEEGLKKVIKTEEETLAELEELQKNLKKNFSSTMRKITKRDIFKGFIGAFIGVIGHFAFVKAADIAVKLSTTRATILYLVAFFIIIIMLYYTGFRKVEMRIIMKFMPFRASLLFLVSVITIIFVNLIFGKIHFPLEFSELYKLVSASIILAVIGAGTADLIGRINEE